MGTMRVNWVFAPATLWRRGDHNKRELKVKATVTVDRYISLDDGGVSEGTIVFENGTRIGGTVETHFHDVPDTFINENTTSLDPNIAQSIFEWAQINLGLDEGQSHETTLNQLESAIADF